MHRTRLPPEEAAYSVGQPDGRRHAPGARCTPVGVKTPGLAESAPRQSGALVNRVATDGAPIRVAPVLAGNSVIVVGSKGTVTAIQAR